MAATTTSAEVTCMYKLPPINGGNDDLTLPDCMYKLPSLYPTQTSKSECVAAMDNPQFEKLAVRQRDILSELQRLKEEMKGITTQLNIKPGQVRPSKQAAKSQTSSKSVLVQAPTLPDGVHDFVISLSPGKLSVSPLLLACVLNKRGMDVTTPTHKHSSLKEDIPSGWIHATGGIKGSLLGGRKKVMFTHIWKEDPFCPFSMYSPIHQTRVYGDVNVARHLVRTLAPDLYNARGIDTVAEIDQWLDVANQIHNGNNKEKESAMKALNGHLGKNTYLVDGCLTLADIVCLSAFLSHPDSFNSLSKNVKKWFQFMSEEFVSVVTPLSLPEESSAVQSDIRAQVPNLPDGVHDYVISLSPNNLSLSPLLLACILRNRGIGVSTPAHKHSSLNGDVPLEWREMLGGINGSLMEGRNKILLTFIWKGFDSEPSIMYSPDDKMKIFGDANIAKYLATSLAADLYDVNDKQNVLEIDAWFKVANQLNSDSSKENETAMKILNDHLAKNTFLVAGRRTLADVVCFAALLANHKTITSLVKNVKTWFKLVSKEFSSIHIPVTWTS